MQIRLTDSEWMALIDAERDGLPRCCAVVSALRDVVIELVRQGCGNGPLPLTALDVREFVHTWRGFVASHQPGTEIATLAAQVEAAYPAEWAASEEVESAHDRA